MNHRLGSAAFDKPGEVVRWMGAVQAQDYRAALWAIGLRMRGGSEAGVKQALVDRSIVRTWAGRGTRHFVAAEDIRWMPALLAPRRVARSAGRLRELGLDGATLARSRRLFTRALQGGEQLSREAMYQVLESAHISTGGQRGIYILQQLALEGHLCFGAREGRQQTFALLEEWAPPGKKLDREEALAELARRYFTSRGPATLKDFVWWSGLTITEARAGLELARLHLARETAEGRDFWLGASTTVVRRGPASAILLPTFDEYLVGYQDRSAVLDPLYVKQINAGGGMLSPAILVDGQVLGAWRRTLNRDSVVITPTWFERPGIAQERAFAGAALQYGAFLGLSVVQP